MEGLLGEGQEGGAPLRPGAPGLGRCPARGPGARGPRLSLPLRERGTSGVGSGAGASRNLLPVVSSPRVNQGEITRAQTQPPHRAAPPGGAVSSEQPHPGKSLRL